MMSDAVAAGMTGKRRGRRCRAGVRRAVLAASACVLAGALYLVAVRGEALLLDLSALGAAHLLLLGQFASALPGTPRAFVR